MVIDESSINSIYRNIQFAPKIWNIEFKSLMICLLLLLFSMMVLRSVFGLLGGLIGGVIGTGSFYAFSYWNDNRDKIEASGKKTPIKKIVASFQIGNQRLKIK